MRYFTELDTGKIEFYTAKQVGMPDHDVMRGAFYAHYLDERHKGVGFVKFLIWLRLACIKASRSGSLVEVETFPAILRMFESTLRVSFKPYLHFVTAAKNKLEKMYGVMWHTRVTYNAEEIMAISIVDSTVAGKYAIYQQIIRLREDCKIPVSVTAAQYDNTLRLILEFIIDRFDIEEGNVRLDCKPCESIYTSMYARFLEALSANTSTMELGRRMAIRASERALSVLFEDAGLLLA
jgi:hypothetical protein